MNVFHFSFLLGCVFLGSCAVSNHSLVETQERVFQFDNLIPWSIVAFDNQERTPKERIEMIKGLGFQQYAFGGREKHIATMEEEMQLAKKNGVEIAAVWLYLNHKKDQVGQLKPMSEQIFRTLKKTDLETQIWVGFHPDYVKGLSHKAALQKSVKMVDYLCQRADSMACKIALYNHGGWFGEPENQLEIICALPQHDIGIVYNFHHGHTHLNRYREILKIILPHLWCLNLNGMKEGGPKILRIGKGNLEKKMIEQTLAMGYKGPFGILGHAKGGDAEVVLKENIEGLYHLFPMKE